MRMTRYTSRAILLSVMPSTSVGSSRHHASSDSRAGKGSNQHFLTPPTFRKHPHTLERRIGL